MYVELKSGYSGDGPAWIGMAKYSKSGQTIYLDGKAFRSLNANGIYGNYYDVISGEEYWISGVKKNEQNRHWAGGGKIMIDKELVQDYLKEIGKPQLSKDYEVVQLKPSEPSKEILEMENNKIQVHEAKPFPGRRTKKQVWNRTDDKDT